ncbi:alpha/beta hydrolase [Microbacteriaceae bacterium 4G12]
MTEVFPAPVAYEAPRSVQAQLYDGAPDFLAGLLFQRTTASAVTTADAPLAAAALAAAAPVTAAPAAPTLDTVPAAAPALDSTPAVDAASVLRAPSSSSPSSSSSASPTSSVLIRDAARGSRGAQAFDPAVLAGLKGPALLTSVSMLSTAQLEAFVAEHPQKVRDLIRTPPAGSQVARWWKNLPPTQQRTLVAGAPEIVGNLEGVPIPVRDGANRRYLEETKDGILDRLDRGVGRGVQQTLLRDLRMLGQIEAALGERTAMPDRSLLTLDTKYPGRAAIALGDLATADYVTFVVPGMFYSVTAHMRDWTDAAARIYDEQAGFQGLFQENRAVATVAWIGYQAPHLMNIGTLDLARQGADYLSNAVDGVRTIQDTDPFVSVIAHSYGTTTTLLALSDGSTRVDAVGLVGSPGSAAQSVDELDVPARNVYVGEAGMDPIVDSAFFGSDPGAASFGAQKMSVAGSVDRLTSEVLNPSRGHNDYFTPGSEAMRNMALIGIDKGRWVTDGTPDDAEKTLALAR